jgi:two-component system, LytTR family, response regulator
MLKAVIVDDDIQNAEILKALLHKFCTSEVEVTGIADTVSGAFKDITLLRPDLVFLDVEMGAETGFDLLAKFREIFFKPIFVTAHDQYALRAIKFSALDYLLKPVAIADLVRAVQKAAHFNRENETRALHNLMQHVNYPVLKSNKIAVPVSTGYVMLAVQDILYCQASREYTNIYCNAKPVICSSLNLGEYEEMLQGYSFCRVHHSYLVNRDYVDEYIRGEAPELVVQKTIIIPVSRRKKQEVADWLHLGR